MERLLCILSGMDIGGAETFLMKVYRILDRTSFRLDFCLSEKKETFYEKEILSLGGRIYRVPPKTKSPGRFRRELYRVIRENGYSRVFRLTSNGMGFMDLMIAKRAGAVVRAVRSCNSKEESRRDRLLNCLGRLLYGRFVNVKLAPSGLAAVYTFGKRAYEAGEVTILHNGLDLSVFRFDAGERERIRGELGIGDSFAVGHVGRFSAQKNHAFLLEIFAALCREREDAKLILVGKGELEGEIRERAEALGIADRVILTGVRTDIPALLSAFDVFLFPSLFEGMPNTVIEAEACGLSCVVADTITREANITGLVEYLPLSASAGEWAMRVLKAPTGHPDTHEAFRKEKYDIDSVAEAFRQTLLEG